MVKDINSNKENTKSIPQIKVNRDLWKKLKILSIQKDLSVEDICIEILEKHTSGKKGVSLEVQEEQ